MGINTGAGAVGGAKGGAESRGNRGGSRTSSSSGGGGAARAAPLKQAPQAPDQPGGNPYAGYKGPIGTRNPTLDAPGSYGLSGPETRAYNAAKDEYGNRSLGKRVVDFLSPVKSINPQINQPSSYANGQYHHGFNPAAVVGGMAPYGLGPLASKLAGAAWTEAGMHDVVLSGPGSGFSTSFPGGGPGYNSSTGFAGPAGMPGSPQGKGNQGGSLLQNLASINQGVSGNPGAPVSVGTPQAPAGPTPTPNYAQMMASIQQVTPSYGVSLPGYQYRKATV